MPQEACILTSKDLTILEVMLDRCLGRDDPMAPLLRRKIASAQVVFSDDVPPDAATLNSRVSFSVDGREADSRILSQGGANSPVGLYLPVTSVRGLALLGLVEGQAFRLAGPGGTQERIVLEKVLYQPEAAKREKEAAERLAPITPRKPVLQLIRGAQYDKPRFGVARPDGFDDPGPSAA